MKEQTSAANNKAELQPYLSPLAVWALSVGSAIGWGSLVVTSSSYLSQAGPMGSIIGLLIGFVMMLMVSGHYHFLANRYPGTGGLYNYVKLIFGYDRAFLIAWFMFLIYISIFWANASSIPLFARYFLQGIFKKGYLYTIFGYDVYLGEALVSLVVMWLVGLLCMKSKKATARMMVTMVLLFTVGITVCFTAAMLGHGRSGTSMSPAFLPDKSVMQQIVRIAFISPWAFIGFETVSHSAAEYKFRHGSMFRVLVISVAVTTALYVFLILLSVSVYPEGCSGWLDYISRLDEFDGISGLPAFYAANYYLGSTGVNILIVSLLSLVLTSLIGMLRALSRLCYAVAQDGMLPERFARLNDRQIPVSAILLVLLVSQPILFLGRTAIGWIVDATTIGATMIYGFASIAVFKVSGQEGRKRNRFISGICLIILAVFAVFLLFPSAFSDYTLATETYVLMAVWSLLGLLYFHGVIRKDHARKFGKAIIVWLALLVFIVLMAMTWSERLNESRENIIIAEISDYMDGTAGTENTERGKDEFLAVQLNRLHAADNASLFVIVGLFGLSMIVMLSNYLSMQKWEKQANEERDAARTVALTDPLTGVKSKHAFILAQKEIDCLRIGAIDFIPKPYPSPEIVLARVNRCIELSEKRNIIQSTERDNLTNLLNLDYFLRYVRMYDQYYSEMPMDAIVLDVNHFHMLNERYGKQYGDSVLSRIGKRVRQIPREIGGVCCRRTADTFFIYCPHREDCESILEKASEGLVDEKVSKNRVRLRMGVYSIVDKSIQIERRFDYAKAAADTVKSGYRKAVGIYDTEMHEAELFRERLLEDFRPSLESNRFMVYFQPKYDVRPEAPVLASAEALVRWNHPELGMISPGVFIPLLEDNGLILDLDQFVWRETAARIREWKDRFGFSVPVSVNVSRIDMLALNLKGIFTDILETYGLSPDDLILEITESAYTGDSEQVISAARELRGAGMGFRIEMDDFGTGYSSLGMLTQLPIDALKLDMSFIRSAFGEKRDVRMIELIIDIADYLHVPAVAEGVETEEQYMALKAMGCDYIQGYYFSKPVPHEMFDHFIAERSEIKTEAMPVSPKAGTDISRALTGDFESIFYVDLDTAFCLEFIKSPDGDLEIRPVGKNFFEDAAERLLEGVSEAEAQKIREATCRAGLTRLAEQEEDLFLPFRREKNGVATPCMLQTLKTRESDHHHIVIGVRQLSDREPDAEQAVK
ncbi:MAG: amino acid permease [Clostridiales bacterium]|nr:amino acid permease [Clostridiales bacterium]